MGDHKKYILNRLAELTGVDIFCQADETLSSYQRNSELNPIFRNSQLRERLMKEAAVQKLPLLHKEEDSIYFICVRSEGQYYFAGPLSLGALNKVELHKYYKRYGIHTDKEKILKRFQFSEVMDIAQIMDAVLNENTTEDMELAKVNHLAAGAEELEAQEKIIYEIKKRRRKCLSPYVSGGTSASGLCAGRDVWRTHFILPGQWMEISENYPEKY